MTMYKRMIRHAAKELVKRQGGAIAADDLLSLHRTISEIGIWGGAEDNTVLAPDVRKRSP